MRREKRNSNCEEFRGSKNEITNETQGTDGADEVFGVHLNPMPTNACRLDSASTILRTKYRELSITGSTACCQAVREGHVLGTEHIATTKGRQCEQEDWAVAVEGRGWWRTFPTVWKILGSNGSGHSAKSSPEEWKWQRCQPPSACRPSEAICEAREGLSPDSGSKSRT